MQIASSPHVTLPGLAEKLERLGVKPMLNPYSVFVKNQLISCSDEDAQSFHLENYHSCSKVYVIFDLLYPENAELLWPGRYADDDEVKWPWNSMKLLELWQRGKDWQSYLERAVDGRLGEGKE